MNDTVKKTNPYKVIYGKRKYDFTICYGNSEAEAEEAFKLYNPDKEVLYIEPYKPAKD